MRVLVLGAGAIGGYVGGRLLEAGGAERVAFLVRPARKALLDQDGIVIESPKIGSFRAHPVQSLLPDQVGPGWDVVLLTCKAYDLEEAIEAIRPAMAEGTAVLPLLNGLAHLDRLAEVFGVDHVLGGAAYVSTTLTSDGVVRQLTQHNRLVFGELDGAMTERVVILKDAFVGAPLQVEAAEDVLLQMWEKLVGLGTLAAATVLMRASIGEIVRAPSGLAWMERLLERGIAAAAAQGHTPRPAIVEGVYHATLRDQHSPLTASMLRDLESGRRIEADHILGHLLAAVRQAGLPDELHEAAYLHAKAYENRRDAGRLPVV